MDEADSERKANFDDNPDFGTFACSNHSMDRKPISDNPHLFLTLDDVCHQLP